MLCLSENSALEYKANLLQLLDSSVVAQYPELLSALIYTDSIQNDTIHVDSLTLCMVKKIEPYYSNDNIISVNVKPTNTLKLPRISFVVTMREHADVWDTIGRRKHLLYSQDEGDNYRSFGVVEQRTDNKGVLWYHVRFELISKVGGSTSSIITSPGPVDGWVKSTDTFFAATEQYVFEK